VVPDSNEILGSVEIKQLLLEAAQTYDYIIVDLPPLNALVDARAIAPALTATLFVVAWGETPISLVREAIMHNRSVAEKCIGVLMNKVDLKLIPQYEPEGILCYGYATY
jgi:succinoglycan biosynthesis transport protein ExoP